MYLSKKEKKNSFRLHHLKKKSQLLSSLWLDLDVGKEGNAKLWSQSQSIVAKRDGTLDWVCSGGFVLVSRTDGGNSTGLENRVDLATRAALFVYVFRLTGLRCRKTMTVDTRDLGDKMSQRGVAVPPPPSPTESEGRRQSLDLFARKKRMTSSLLDT